MSFIYRQGPWPVVGALIIYWVDGNGCTRELILTGLALCSRHLAPTPRAIFSVFSSQILALPKAGELGAKPWPCVRVGILTLPGPGHLLTCAPASDQPGPWGLGLPGSRGGKGSL